MAWIARTFAWLVAACVLAWVLGFLWTRLRPPTAEQAQALSLLATRPPPADAPNAWANFWLLDYDIPAAQIASAYALEREQLAAWAQHRRDASAPGDYVGTLGQRFSKRPALSPDDQKQLCRGADDDCLAKVRANAPVLGKLLAAQAGRLAQIRAIPLNAVLWDDTPLSLDTPTPSFAQAGNLRLTAAAWDFVDGRQEVAMAQVCHDARVVRQLHAHTNSLLGAMVADAWMDSIERLLAGMLQEWPAVQPVPADCALAFAPVTRADVDLCAPVRREYQYALTAMAIVDGEPSHGASRLQRLLVAPGRTRALLAPRYAWSCQAQTIDDMQNDIRLSSDQIPPLRFDLFDRVANPMGRLLAGVAAPRYTKYMNRNEDFAAGLRLTSWLLATRASATTPQAWRKAFHQALPALQRGGSRRFQLDASKGQLLMPYSMPRRHRDALVLPLSP